MPTHIHPLPPHLRPPRKHPLIQTQTHRIDLTHRPVEVRLEVPVRAQTFFDMSYASVFGVELDGGKEGDVGWVEEHVADGGGLLVHTVGVAGEDDAFGEDAGGVGWEKGAHCDEFGFWKGG